MVRHRNSDAFWSQGRRSLQHAEDEFGGEEGSVEARVLAARTSIIAAKYAYATNRPQWLSLFARVIERVELCPPEYQASLMRELHRFLEPEKVRVSVR